MCGKKPVWIPSYERAWKQANIVNFSNSNIYINIEKGKSIRNSLKTHTHTFLQYDEFVSEQTGYNSMFQKRHKFDLVYKQLFSLSFDG